MRLLIRCDGGPAIGMGHVVRSGALAQALENRGAAVAFAMKRDLRAGIDAVQEMGFDILPLDGDDDFIEAASAYDGTIVDHYGIGAGVLEQAGKRTFLAAIDDEALRDLSAARWLLNQNPGAPQLGYRIPSSTVCLFGTDYALLRPQFAQARASLHRVFSADDTRVLLSFGGGDVSHLIDRALRAIQSTSRSLQVRVLGVPHMTTEQVVHMMAWADVCVSAAGSTCWELCCMQTPTIAFPIAGNQSVVARGLKDAAAAIVFESVDAALADLLGELQRLLARTEERRSLAERAGRLVDGAGADRAACSLIEAIQRS